ncbi:glycoside hydrolase family 52 protein [Piscibacillus halophilus]|uniref:Glycosyl hydrolase family 52 n=1 Tax=Piscibacillus halophilus TaxID=571933 RepID=A0A1H9HUX4_9BACI|nr:glycoside hydrolase family 52 protein [Piscibacillus halophilus]SEQ66032.1 Glycosyl hydrolase family 52 [Piscibacillus halophilus]
MPKNIFFNAHHSPIGSYSSFTLGFPGAGGGLDVELGRSPRESVFIGVESLEQDGKYEALPFFEGKEDESLRFDIENPDPNPDKPEVIIPFSRENIQREFQLGTDTWKAGDLTFTVYNQARSIPEPEKATDEELKKVLLPAVFGELTIDNRSGERTRKAFFGYEGSDPYTSMRRLDDTSSLIGVGQGRLTAVSTNDSQAKSAMHFSMEDILLEEDEDNWTFGLGSVGALIFEVPAGEVRSFPICISFFRDGWATVGLDTKYYYTNLFKDIEDVSSYALEHFNEFIELCKESNQLIESSNLNNDQKFMVAHAIRSYYGNTQLLEQDGKPLWVVNEGEYRMMNTFDLTVDQLFYELKMNPWVMRNVLDLFVDRYSYVDQVKFPESEEQYPGGRSFTHDMGVANTFSRPEYSSYELYNIDGCFSHMTHEQLLNWVLTAASYVMKTSDDEWFRDKKSVFEECLNSLLNRDHPDASKRNGVMGLDSSRTKNGAEITTYDSLDISLGQSRNNIYLASKSWAAYVLLKNLYEQYGEDHLAKVAHEQALKCSDTIVSHVNEEGFIPAVIEKNNQSRIIPAIEGLIYPYFIGDEEAVSEDGEFGHYIKALKHHLNTVLVKGVCLFDDGGWKISSTSNNSWLSKIYLNQYIARQILGFPWGEEGQAADRAHVQWLTHPELSIWSWSDQIINGEISASKYYPRGVTSILWLDE